MSSKSKILIDIPHPHFVHFYRNAIKLLDNNNVIVTCQDIPIIRTLLEGYGIRYEIIGRKATGYFNKIVAHLGYANRYAGLILRHRVRTVVGTATSMMFVGLLLGRKRVFFDDDDSAVQGMVLKLNVLLSDYVVTPLCLKFENYGSKHYTYRGYQELAYLSPQNFTPDRAVTERYGLTPGSYAILRLNSFLAYHDIDHSGIGSDLRDKIIALLKKHNLRVLISNENAVAEKYRCYLISIDPIDIHHVMHDAAIYIGDSQTMASEAAVLGVPSIRCNTFKDKIAYLGELEHKYQLTKAFLPTEGKPLLKHLNELLDTPELSAVWEERRQKMLHDMEDVNAFIVTFLDKHGLR